MNQLKWVVIALLLAGPLKAQTFAPVNDSLAITLTIWNFDHDSAEVFAVGDSVAKSIGFVYGGMRKTFTLTSASLGKVKAITLVIQESGNLIQPRRPAYLPRGSTSTIVIGTPPPKRENA